MMQSTFRMARTGLRIGWRGTRLALRIVRYTAALAILLFLLQRSTYPTGARWSTISVMVSEEQFDFIAWEAEALWTKVEQFLFGVHPFMDEAERSDYVRAYMRDLAAAQALEAQIADIYADPTVTDPEAVSADLRQQRDRLRDDLSDRQGLVESILEGQVAAVLTDEGFGVLGQLLPPIAMHFTQTPNLLVVSPRDRISPVAYFNLDPLTVDERAAIEAEVDARLDVVSLIVPTGGVAVYPAMILETTSIPWALQTFAHEWLHHYLYFFPLGLEYEFTGEARIINETVADIFGREIGRMALERYYPDLVAAETDGTVRLASYVTRMQVEPVFDYGAAMNTTRVRVDKYLADVQALRQKADRFVEAELTALAERHDTLADALVAEAEAYMERRRLYFWENGVQIRKLNQAYFAFYGGYQGGIPGIGGEDPIGPAVRAIRDMSPGVERFVITMRTITTRDELLRVRDAMLAERTESTP